MKSIVLLLEQELEGAVSVKDTGFLHRYITLMAENFVLKDEHVVETGAVRSDIRLLTEVMKQSFERVDRRFEAVDKRFEAVDKRFDDMLSLMDRRFEAVDKRFDDMNKRFTMMFSFITVGFVVVSTLVTLYQFLT